MIVAATLLINTSVNAGPAERCAAYKAEGVAVPVLGKPLVALLGSPDSYVGCRVYTEGYLGGGVGPYVSPEDLKYESRINGLFIGNDLGSEAVRPRDRAGFNGRRVGVRGVFSVGHGGTVGSIHDVELLKAVEVRKAGPGVLGPD